jgi:transcriptional regulator with XRE-family HTH domain
MSVAECVSFQHGPGGSACGLRWTVDGESMATVVAGNLGRLRLDRGWTQVELGRRLAPLVGRVVNQAQVSTWETLRSQVSVDMIAVLASVLECPLIEFFRLPERSSLRVIVTDDADLVSRSDAELIAELGRRLARQPVSRSVAACEAIAGFGQSVDVVGAGEHVVTEGPGLV